MARQAEIYALGREYKRPGSRVLLFYGREGLGREESVREFLKGKDFFYYRASSLSDDAQEQKFTEAVRQRCPFLEGGGYAACLNALQEDGGGKLVAVIDEFQHMARKGSDFIRQLFSLKHSGKREVLILLCSSSIVFVEHKINDALGDLFYEIDSVHKMRDMDFIDIVHLFPEKPVSECVEIFGILGGTPAYLQCFDAKKSVKENICRSVLSPNGKLFLEAERYLRTELRELSVYNTILAAIAAGSQKLNDLHHGTGFSRAKISVYLNNLMEFDVVEKIMPFESEHAQKGIYQIKHTFLHFWFRFVFPHLSDLYLLKPEEFYDSRVAGGLDEYLEPHFTRVCMEYMKLMNRAGKLPIEMKWIQTWPGKRGKIDIVAQDAAGSSIVGACNWSRGEMPYERLEQLMELAAQAGISPKCVYLFSGKSFEKKLMELAGREKNVILVDMTEL